MPADGEVVPAVVHGRKKRCRRCQAVLLNVPVGMALQRKVQAAARGRCPRPGQLQLGVPKLLLLLPWQTLLLIELRHFLTARLRRGRAPSVRGARRLLRGLHVVQRHRREVTALRDRRRWMTMR